MRQSIIQVALLVEDYNEAINFYVNKLNFSLIEDTILSTHKRWVLVRPPGISETCLLLAKAADAAQKLAIGNQSGGRVFLFLHTDNFQRDYTDMLAKGIVFVREPVTETYGTVAVFKDLYGNLWDLIQSNTK